MRLKRLDEALGRLNDALISTGQRENTIVVYTSDHGCHFKTRNGEYKRSCHEASIRVPTAVQGPGFDAGGRRRELVSLLDLPPTLLDAAGIEVLDGEELMERTRAIKGPDEILAMRCAIRATSRSARAPSPRSCVSRGM